MTDEGIQVPDDLSGLDADVVFSMHELAYDEMDTFDTEFKLACYHLTKFVKSIRSSMKNEETKNYSSSLIHLDFGVAEAIVQLEHGTQRNRWRITIDMHRPDVMGQE